MSEVKFETVEQKASYGIGLQMGQQLAGSGLEGLSVDAIAAGIATALVGDMPAIEIDEINSALQDLHQRAESAGQESAKAAAAGQRLDCKPEPWKNTKSSEYGSSAPIKFLQLSRLL